MSAVPRKAEAHVSGLERARIGAAAADAREGSARSDALEDARSSALEHVSDPAGLAEWCELAACNLDMAAKPLLEAHGQGARGALRTRAWIMRNGARISKGERGTAVSMFGGYVWELRQSTKRFGTVGLVADGAAPAAEHAGWSELAGGDAIAGAIICALRGYRLAHVSARVDAKRLDDALGRARAVAWRMPACLSCDGAGCLACSCLDDKSRVGMLDSNFVDDVPVSAVAADAPARRVGRPPKLRPPLPELEAAMRDVRRLRDEADGLRLEAATLERRAMRAAAAKHSLGDVAAAAGVSKARIAQIVGDS